MNIVRYSEHDALRWDHFVQDSKNGTFLFLRHYMDYHRDRFTDHSLIIEDIKGRILALIPANQTFIDNKRIFFSHQGLTYGGLILSKATKITEVLEIFSLTIEYLKSQSFTSWYYKQIPTIYHKFPSEEDTYALWKQNAILSSSLISATIALTPEHKTINADPERRRGKNHALQEGYQIMESSDPELFWPIMEKNLMDKYGAKPVHTLSEMKLLMTNFPQNIKCFLAVKDNIPQAGAIVYLANRRTAHLQYCHATEVGKKDRVIDFLYIHLTEYLQQQGYQYFDLGTSNENGGHYLNQSLIAHKQSFGARGIAYNTYRINLE